MSAEDRGEQFYPSTGGRDIRHWHRDSPDRCVHESQLKRRLNGILISLHGFLAVWRCIKRRCIIRRWKDLRLAAYSFWYLIEKSLVFCWLFVVLSVQQHHGYWVSAVFRCDPSYDSWAGGCIAGRHSLDYQFNCGCVPGLWVRRCLRHVQLIYCRLDRPSKRQDLPQHKNQVYRRH